MMLLVQPLKGMKPIRGDKDLAVTFDGPREKNVDREPCIRSGKETIRRRVEHHI